MSIWPPVMSLEINGEFRGSSNICMLCIKGIANCIDDDDDDWWLIQIP